MMPPWGFYFKKPWCYTAECFPSSHGYEIKYSTDICLILKVLVMHLFKQYPALQMVDSH